MKITKAEFVISSGDYTQCPKLNVPEYAFIGRSNVGKSSLINMLTGVSGLAKTSSKPGKTQCINHFTINQNQWFLVDLPGYGFARVSKENKEKWKAMTENYLLKRNNLCCVFVLVDMRLTPQKIDLAFMEWLGNSHIPFTILGTKTDKVSAPLLAIHLQALNEEMSKIWQPLPTIILTSAQTKLGKEDILNLIDSINNY
ncbi:MAG: ribosome biogenesis GTP-binding protein YihA/YsxC [Bacteroidales bacterium]